MREIFITFLIFGLVTLLASTRVKQSPSATPTKQKTLTSDRAPTQSMGENTSELQSATTTGMPAVADSPVAAASTGAAATLPPLLDLEPEVSLPLAASLSLQDVVNPESTQTEIKPDLLPETATIIEATDASDTEKAKDRDHQNVLEEIAQLGEAHNETAIATLLRHANHANPMVRATAAMTLGELVAKNPGQPQDEIIAVLNRLLQDSNSEVQLQAAAALGKMQLPVDLT